MDDNDFDKELGKRLRHYRMERNMSQTALGDALGVSFQMIQKYEKGQARLSCKSLVKAAAVLKVSVTDLLGFC